MSPLTILVGSHTNVITSLSFDPAASPHPTLRVIGTSYAGSSPSWIAAHPTDKTLVFASNETAEGKILMFNVKADGLLELLQTVWSGGKDPAHFLVGEKEIVSANYSSGTLSTIPLELSPPKLLAPPNAPVTFDFPGTGPHAARQEASHPHQVGGDASSKQLLVPDLGSDKVWKLGRDSKTLSWKVMGEIAVRAGRGPRHLVVGGETLYVLNELESTVSAYSYGDAGTVDIKELSTLSTLTPPAKPTEEMLGAELLLSAATKAYPEALVYASNRNDPHEEGDSIAIFSTVESAKGFALVNEVRTGLHHLRAMTFGGPEDRYVVAGGLNGGGIKVFERVDQGRSLEQVAHLEPGAVERPASFVVLQVVGDVEP